jgi:tellurite methyltransferase
MDNYFWNEYYSTKIEGDSVMTQDPSSFALYVSPYVWYGDKVVDLGSGNGRDSVYFKSITPIVTAIDICDASAPYFENKNIKFVCKSIADIGDECGNVVDVGYSRFSLHSITEVEQVKLFDWASDHCKLFCIETRSTNDPRCGKGASCEGEDNAYVDSHYRRFTRLSDLTKALVSRGFSIVRAEEDFMNARYKDDHAVVNRIVCQNKKLYKS